MSTDHHDHSDHEDVGCLEAIEGLYQWLDGDRDGPHSIEHIEHHIQHCRSCYSRAELERILTERLKKTQFEGAPESLHDRVQGLIDKF